MSIDGISPKRGRRDLSLVVKRRLAILKLRASFVLGSLTVAVLLAVVLYQHAHIRELTTREAHATYESRGHAWMSLEQAKQAVRACQGNIADISGCRTNGMIGLISSQKAIGVMAIFDPMGRDWTPIIHALGDAQRALASIPTSGLLNAQQQGNLSKILDLVNEVAGALPVIDPTDSTISVWDGPLIDRATTKALSFSSENS